jgi:hypothetical protein
LRLLAAGSVLAALICNANIALADSGKKTKQPPAPAVPAKPEPAPGTRTAADLARELGTRHGIRVIVDPAVPAEAVPGLPSGLSLEATLRALFAGNEIVLQYGSDGQSAGERLKSVWVFPRSAAGAVRVTAGSDNVVVAGADSRDAQERAAAVHRISGESGRAAQAALSRATEDADENVRMQALQAGRATSTAPSAEALKRMIESDPSEAVRMSALETFVTSPGADEYEVKGLLDRLADGTPGALSELARAMREARTPASFEVPMPEPIEAPK